MSTPLPDQNARDRIRHELGTTFVVEAAAGTGKTTALVDRIVAVIEAGAGTLDQLVALTFTEKAAGEMKLRLRGRLEQQRARHPANSEADARLTAALQALEAASVGTIHGFCSDLLHERPVEAGVDPRFEVVAGDEEQTLLDQAFDEFLQEALEAPGEGLRRALRRNDRPGQALASLRSAAATLVEQRDFDGAWEHPAVNRRRLLDETLQALQPAAVYAELASSPTDPLGRCLKEMQAVLDDVARGEQTLGERDDDATEYALRKLSKSFSFRRQGRGRYYAKDLPRDVVLAARDTAKETLDQAVAVLEADLAARLHGELGDVVRRYEERKAEGGRLDYLDLLLRTRNLLRDNGTVRSVLQARYSHVFVDEFQDIDPLQADIIHYLCGGDGWDDPGGAPLIAGKLFVVGDPKQAIYRFRRADVALYERVKRALVEGGAEVLQLTTSFRSRAAIQSVINAAFAEHMVDAADGHQATYQALQPYRAETSALSETPAVVALPIVGASARGAYLAKKTVEEHTPKTVAAFIDRLLESGMKVIEPDGTEVPVAARHICLLFRRFRNWGDDVTRPYVRALEARRIPHVLLGGRSFHLREEIIALRAALHAIEWPDDALHVYATLRGPFISLSDEALFSYSNQRGSLHPLHPSAQAGSDEVPVPLHEVHTALSLLRDLHRGRNRRPVAETIHRLLEATRAHAGIAIWPTGEQALANVMRVIDLSRHYETRGATSFRGFVEWLSQSAERQDLGEAPVIEEGTDGVRMMTVHTAKGLEFPVVILCDPTARRETSTPSRYIDLPRRVWASRLCGCTPLELQEHAQEVIAQDDAEEVRISYVAATRARDVLVVPIVDDERQAGWLDPLYRGIYPKPGHHTLRAPPPNLNTAQNKTTDCRLEAGFHVPERGEHRTLVWDVSTLDVDRAPVFGLRQQDLLVEDKQGRKTREGLTRYEHWRERRGVAIGQGSLPTHPALTVTALSHTEGQEAEAAAVEHVKRADGRPRGARFGTLVHAVLADSGFDSEAKTLQALSRFHGAQLDATVAEVEHAAKAVAAALQHPVMQAAHKSDDARFEVPVTHRLPDGRIVEGVIDLLFRNPAGSETRWTVVDFKTDPDPGAIPEYGAQVALYAAAVEAATNESVSTTLLAV